MPHFPVPLRILLIGLLILLLPAVGAAMGPRHAPKDAKQQIASLEQQWRTATLNTDLTLMDRLLSEDYVGISWTGQVNNKSSQLDRLRTRSVVVTRMDLSDQKIKVVQTVAIVTSKADVEGTNDGVAMNGSYRYTRIYQRLPGGGWKITNFEATRLPKGNRRNREPDAIPETPPAASPNVQNPPRTAGSVLFE